MSRTLPRAMSLRSAMLVSNTGVVGLIDFLGAPPIILLESDAPFHSDPGLQRANRCREEPVFGASRAPAGGHGTRAGDRGRLFHRRDLRDSGGSGGEGAAHPLISPRRESREGSAGA